MTTDEIISWSQVTELRDDVGPEDFGDVVDIFLEEVSETLDSLAHGDRLGATLHALKGSALNLGFSRFSRLCAEGEALAARGAGDEVDLALIRQTYVESRDLFLAELPARLAA